VYEACHTYESVLCVCVCVCDEFVGVSVVTGSDEACNLCQVYESCHTYESVMYVCQEWMAHMWLATSYELTHLNESCHTYAQVVSHV